MLRIVLVAHRLLWRKIVVVAVLALMAGTGVLVAAGVIGALVHSAYTVPVPRSIISSGLVVSSYSIAPYTSLLSVDMVKERLAGINASITPIVLAPAITSDDEPVLVLGLPDSLLKRLGLERCSGCAYASPSLAKRLGVENNTIIVLDSVFTRTSIPLRLVIAQAYEGCTLVTSLDTARLVRGMYPGQATLIVIHPSSRKEAAVIAKRLGLGKERLLVQRLVYIALRKGKTVIAGSPEQLYLERIGLAPRLVAALSIVSGILLALVLYLLPGLLAELGRVEIMILVWIGATSRAIRASLALPLVIAASLSPLLYKLLSPWLGETLSIGLMGCPAPLWISSREALVLTAASTLILVLGARGARVST